MSSLVSYLHQLVSAAVAVLWWPIQSLPLPLQLVIVSVVFGLFMVFLFGKLSNQGAIKRVKEQIVAALLEVYLFRRDIRLSLRAQGRLFSSGARYLVLALGPVLVLLVPFAVLLGHFNLRLGNKPIEVGAPAVLTVKVARSTPLDTVSLTAPSVVETIGPVRMERERELVWRLLPKEAGRYDVAVSAGDAVAKESLAAGSADGSPVGIFYSAEDWLTQLVYPDAVREARRSGAIRHVSMDFPQHPYSLLGFELSWVTAFLIVSLLAGYAGSKFLGISV